MARSFFTNTADCVSVVWSGGNMLCHCKHRENSRCNQNRWQLTSLPNRSWRLCQQLHAWGRVDWFDVGMWNQIQTRSGSLAPQFTNLAIDRTLGIDEAHAQQLDLGLLVFRKLKSHSMIRIYSQWLHEFCSKSPSPFSLKIPWNLSIPAQNCDR